MCLHQWRNENYIQEVVVGMHLGMHGIFLGDSNFSFLVFRFSGPHNNKEWPVTREEVETRKIGRNETRTFQGLFPGCTRVGKKLKHGK